jgi:hypothetical protein
MLKGYVRDTYICKDWTMVPHMISLEKEVLAFNANHFISLVVKALEKSGDIGKYDMVGKMMYFGTSCITIF